MNYVKCEVRVIQTMKYITLACALAKSDKKVHRNARYTLEFPIIYFLSSCKHKN